MNQRPHRGFPSVLVAGASRVSGYGLSVVALALASLAAIPAMIHTDGAAAWASVAVGQSLGGVAAVIIGYGWGMTGPARIAAASPAQQRAEYTNSLRVKLCLIVPASGAAALIAVFLAPAYPVHALMGALAMSSVGLSANWLFAGLRRPYAQFAAETLPRITGTGIGILLMYQGASAVIGVGCQLAGMILGCAVASVWATRTLPPSSEARPLLRQLFAQQSGGLTSTVLSAAYVAAPVAIVTQVAPVALPVFALIDKVQRQVSVGLGPLVVVAQAWVPRGRGERGVRRRVAQCVTVATVAAVALGAMTFLAAPFLFQWLSRGSVEVSHIALLLAAAFVAIGFLENTVSKAVMPAIGRVRTAATAASISMVVGLPLVAIGAAWDGAIGALSGVVLGLFTRLAIELGAATRGPADTTTSKPPVGASEGRTI